MASTALIPQLPPELWARILLLTCDDLCSLFPLTTLTRTVHSLTWRSPSYKRRFSLDRAGQGRLLHRLRDAGRTNPGGLLDLVRGLIDDGTLRYTEDEAPNTLYRFLEWFRGDERCRPAIDLLKSSGFKKPFWQPNCLKEERSTTLARIRAAFPRAMGDASWEVGMGWARVLWRLLERLDESGTGPVGFISEKYGRLRCGGGGDGRRAQIEASRTCDLCGRKGRLRNQREWQYVMCDACDADASGDDDSAHEDDGGDDD
ncbi:hypothetical protein HK101_005833, partial [Irineochytrium annulatum]